MSQNKISKLKKILPPLIFCAINIIISVYAVEHFTKYRWNENELCRQTEITFTKRLERSILWDWLFY